MLNKRERLPRAAIERIHREGRRLNGAYFSIRYRQAERFKAAVVISKRVAKTAVLRHRAKRKAIEALRLALGARAVSLELVVHITKSITSISQEALIADLRSVIDNVKGRV